MIKDYEDFKKFILQSTTIDLNAYKERQMKRRIDTLISRNKYDGYDSYSQAIKKDKKRWKNSSIILRLMYLNFTAIRRFGRR